MASTSSAPSATARPTGQAWTFHVETGEGWEYDVELSIDFKASFSSIITHSPPGKSRLAATARGSSSATINPTLSGRTAPAVQLASVRACFVLPANPFTHTGTTLQPAGRCGLGSYPHPEDVGSDTAFTCEVADFNNYARVDNDEAEVESAARILNSETPVIYSASLAGAGQCDVILFPDGRAQTHWNDLAIKDRPAPLCRVTKR